MKHLQLATVSTRLSALVTTMFVGLVVLLFTGCGAMKPESASFASVVIKGAEPNAIRDATIAVFQEDGYKAGTMGNQLVFQREASRITSLAYEGVVDTHYGASTLVRVKMDLVNLGEGSYRLQCQAFIVKDAGDAFFAEEQRLANIRSRPYQSLLDKVAKKFK